MYHAFVKRTVTRVFAQVDAGDHQAVLAGCAPDIHHRFGGAHALGGERHDREALTQWFARLGRLCPDLSLQVHDVWVKGLPYNTTAVIRWTSSATRPDGTRYDNHGVHVVRMRWGKAASIDANEDSQAVAELLDQLAAAGVAEAHAAQIVS